jgi:hypothetical protein
VGAASSIYSGSYGGLSRFQKAAALRNGFQVVHNYSCPQRRLPAAHLKIVETIVMHPANSTTSSLLHESQEAPVYSSYHFSLALSSLIPFAWAAFPCPQCVSPPVPESWFPGSSYAASGFTPISIQAPLCIAGCDKNPPHSRIPSGALGQSVGFFRHVYTES